MVFLEDAVLSSALILGFCSVLGVRVRFCICLGQCMSDVHGLWQLHFRKYGSHGLVGFLGVLVVLFVGVTGDTVTIVFWEALVSTHLPSGTLTA